MAINKIIYDVNGEEIVDSEGHVTVYGIDGTSNRVNKVVYGQNVLIDITDTTATADQVLSGYVAYGANGVKITGTAGQAIEAGGGEVDDDTLIVDSGGSSATLQNKTVTPTTSTQSVTADSGYDGLDTVTVNPIPSQYIVPSGSKSISANGTVDVTSYASAAVNVQPSLQSKSATPTTSSQTISADSNYDGLSSVTVGAIPSQYIVPSGTKEITANGTGIDVTSYASVNVAVPTGSSKNVQAYLGYDEVNSGSYVATDVSLTVAKTGTYKVSWMGYRNTTSGTSGSQLYIGDTAYGSANTTFVRSYGHSVVLDNVSLTKNQVITVYARSRNTSYYMGVGNLIIEEQ